MGQPELDCRSQNAGPQTSGSDGDREALVCDPLPTHYVERGGQLAGSAGLRGGDTGPSGGIEQYPGGHLEALDGAERDFLVFDVDEHVGVHHVQGGEPGRPVDGVVAATESDEIPGSVFGPLVSPLVTSQVGARLIRAQPTEPIVEYAVNSGGRIDAYVLRGGMEHKRAEVLHYRYWIHPLPEQVRGVQLHPDIGRASALDELPNPGRVEHQVLWVQLECHLDVEVGRLAVDLPPEFLGESPLVVEYVEGAGVPRVHDPVWPGATRLPGW